jgi:hypothetical protein
MLDGASLPHRPGKLAQVRGDESLDVEATGRDQSAGKAEVIDLETDWQRCRVSAVISPA